MEQKAIEKQDMTGKRFPKKLGLLLYFLRRSKRYFGLAILFAGFMALLELVNPKIIGYTVDSIVGNETSEIPQFLASKLADLGGRDYLISHLWLVGLLVVLVALSAGISRYMFGVMNSKGAERLVKNMRDDLYNQIMKLPYAWHGENKTGDIIQRCTSDVEMIKRFLSGQLTGLFRIAILIILSVYFMTTINGRFTLIAAAFIPVVFAYSLLFHRKMRDSFRKVDEEEGKLSAIAQENLTGVRVVRAFGREQYERERFETKNEEYTGMWVHLMRLMSQFWCTSDLISGLQFITCIVVGCILCIRGEITLGEYIQFFSYNQMLIWPVRQLGRMISEMSKAGISIERIQYIMNSEPEKDDPDAVDWPGNGDIEFSNLSFSYTNKGTERELKDVSFTIPKGSTIGILGGTGSGKSTLMHVLDRLYEIPDGHGKITIGGVDIRKIRISELRSHIGLVLQEPYLFSRSLAENIRISVEGADMDKVRQAARLAALDSSVEKFTEGYDTTVGERGVTLSGGQKQRTAIAQMLIREPDIEIFDDSLSAVDAATDSQIRHAIAKRENKSTTILISHRITTLMQADEILVFEAGRLAERGTHQQLLDQNGIYRKIYDLQKQQM